MLPRRIRVRRSVGGCCVAVALATTAASPASGQVVLDGTLGAAGALGGPNYDIPAGVGQLRGGNLFHSFSTFSIAAGETATFSGPTSVTNLLARVTGGTASNIDGTIRCAIPGANVYLMNPAGVVFGPSASLDVSGSFAVTTADVVRLADGGRFNAAAPADTVLTSASPAAFGFLSPAPATVRVDGAGGSQPTTLAVASGKTLSVAAGDVRIVGGKLQAPGGRIAVTAAGGPVDVPVDGSEPSVASGPVERAVEILDGSGIDADGPGGGRVVIRAGTLRVVRSDVTAQTLGDQPSAGIDVRTAGPIELDAGRLLGDTFAAGRAGDVGVTAGGDLVLANASRIRASTEIGTRGAAGDVSVTAGGDLQILSGSAILSNPFGSGPGGSVNVDVTGALLLEGGSAIATLAQAEGTGAAGNVTVRAGTVRVRSGAQIAAGTFGPGASGDVSVDARDVVVDANGDPFFTGIASNSAADGPSGDVRVNATGSVQVLNGGQISGTVASTGGGGMVAVTAPFILLDGTARLDGAPTGAPATSTGIIAQTQAPFLAGRGSDVRVNAGALRIVNAGRVSTTSFGAGQGGSVDITADELEIDGGLADPDTGILSRAEGELPGAGAAGGITIDVRDARVLNLGGIDASTFGPGAGGNIDLEATGAILVDGGDRVIVGSSTGIRSLTFGIAADSGNAGAVKVSADSIRVTRGALIRSETQGAGDGGLVELDAREAVLDPAGLTFVADDGSTVLAATGVSGESRNFDEVQKLTAGNGGRVVIRADDLRVLNGARVTTQTNTAGAGGAIDITAGRLELSSPPGGGGGVSSNTFGSGAGGPITITADAVQVLNQTQIAAAANATGNGGPIMINAGTLLLDGGGDSGGGINAQTGSTPTGGRGSDVTLRVGELRVTNRAGISAGTLGGGAGGNIDVRADTALIDRGGLVGAITTGGAGGGPGGNITLRAGSLTVDDAGVSVSSSAAGAAGAITVEATDVLITGPGTDVSATSVPNQFSPSPVPGRGGDITIEATRVRVADGARVTAATGTSSPGGRVVIEADQVRIDGTPERRGTVLAQTLSTGPGGRIEITAGDLTLDGGLVSASSTFTGEPAAGDGGGGGQQVAAGLVGGDAGSIDVNAARNVTLSNGASISVEAAAANGGDVTVNAADRISVSRSSIITRAAGTGGNIFLGSRNATTGAINPSFITFNAAEINANAVAGNGGNITLISDEYVTSSDTIVTATSEQSDPGKVDISAAYTELAGGLIQLPSGFANDAAELQDLCGLRVTDAETSSFIATGRGGAPLTPGGVQPSFDLPRPTR